MRTRVEVALVIVAALALPRPGNAEIAAVKSERGEVDVGGMAQVMGFGQHLRDPYKNDNRVYLFMKEARLRFSGRYDDITFYSEMALGGEEQVVAQTGVSLSLLDFSFNVPLSANKSMYLKVGQFKVPYGREALTYSAFTQFADRSIDYLGFRVGRDVGVALVSQPGPFTFIGGVFTGGGRDIPPQHYLPEKLGVPLLVARVGVGNVDDDPFVLKQDNLGNSSRRKQAGVFVNALYTKDSSVGHSTVLNVKLADKSLLLNSNWNPFIAQAPLDDGTWWQTGGDVVARAPLGMVDVASEIEMNVGKYSNQYGSVSTWGTREQLGVLYRVFEVAVRHALLVPDAKFANAGVPLTGSSPINEITPSLLWFIRGQALKVVADLPVLVRAPVFTETNVGAYVGTELPDQAAVVKGGGGAAARQTVIEGRLMLQAQF